MQEILPFPTSTDKLRLTITFTLPNFSSRIMSCENKIFKVSAEFLERDFKNINHFYKSNFGVKGAFLKNVQTYYLSK